MFIFSVDLCKYLNHNLFRTEFAQKIRKKSNSASVISKFRIAGQELFTQMVNLAIGIMPHYVQLILGIKSLVNTYIGQLKYNETIRPNLTF